jgi:iron-siderophore transport system substrate-binding protein
MPKLARHLVAAVVAALTLTACGSPSPAGPVADAPAAGGAFPVQVTHKYGTTEVKKADRIVTLGLSDHEIVLALGVKPVGVIDWFKERPFGVFPWQKAKWGDTQPEIVGERDDYNIEKIAALKPDLIIAQYSGMKKEQYDTLSKLSPVVAQPVGFEDYAAPWQDMARAVGKAMGKSAEVEARITGIGDKFAQVRKDHPEFAGRKVIVADNFEPGVFSAFAASDPKTLFMTEIGFGVPEVISSAPKAENVIDFGAERLDVFDVDTLIWLTSAPDAEQRLKTEPLYTRLKVATEGRDLFVPYEQPPVGASISFNTVLSIPYAIDNLVPLLTGVVK